MMLPYVEDEDAARQPDPLKIEPKGQINIDPILL